MDKFRVGIFLGCLFFSAVTCSASTRVIYPADEIETDSRHGDLIEILNTALMKTVPEFGPYELKPSHSRMNEARYMLDLQKGEEVNVAWSATSVEKEQAYLPIRIPLRKGILGYRILLIAKDAQKRIDQVHTVEDLKKIMVGQGIGWGDVDLYRSNGLTVTTANYDNLFRMVAANRIDIFPRGVNEVLPEYEHYVKENPNLAIEKNLLIYYPWPFYFFFNKADVALHDRIEAGLGKMIKDGSFDAIFKKYNRRMIQQLDLKSRRIITLNNTLLPKETPLNIPEFWFDPRRN